MAYNTASGLTVVIETWPYDRDLIERAALSVASIADRTLLLGLEGPMEPLMALPPGLGGWAAIPWQGDFAVWRNRLLSTVDTTWILWMYGNEQLVRMDIGLLREATMRYRRCGYRLNIDGLDQWKQAGNDTIRLIPRAPMVRFSGHLVPNVAASLTEFGYGVEDLPVSLARGEGIGVRGRPKEWVQLVSKTLVGQLAQQPENRIKLAMLHYGLQQWDVALDWLNKRPMSNDEDLAEIWQMESLYLTASIAMAQGTLEIARKTLEKAVRTYPYSTDFLFLIGRAMLLTQDYDDAYAVMQMALEQGEDHVLYGEPGTGSYVCRIWIADIEVKRKRYKQAVKEYMSLLAQYPYFRSAWRAFLALVDDQSPRNIVDLLGMALSKTQMRDYLTRQPFLSPAETKIRDWLDAN